MAQNLSRKIQLLVSEIFTISVIKSNAQNLIMLFSFAYIALSNIIVMTLLPAFLVICLMTIFFHFYKHANLYLVVRTYY